VAARDFPRSTVALSSERGGGACVREGSGKADRENRNASVAPTSLLFITCGQRYHTPREVGKRAGDSILSGRATPRLSGYAYQELGLAYLIKRTANRHPTAARVSVFS